MTKLLDDPFYESICKKLIFSLDCTQALPADSFYEVGRTSVVNSPCGSYREAAPDAHSRFGYRFSVNNPGMLHLMVIRYPDDKRRFMCVNDGAGYDLTTGVTSGIRDAVSGSMKTIYNFFRPRWKDASVTFSSWGRGEPAAVCEFAVYEVGELPVHSVACEKDNRRSFGIQYEDPCGIALAEGSLNFKEWLDYLTEYMKFTGQNRLIYPVNWYDGPIIPVDCQPWVRQKDYTAMLDDTREIIHNENLWGEIIGNKCEHAEEFQTFDNWAEILLERFAKENLKFTGSLTLLRLGNLFKNMNCDMESVRNGADTYNSITASGGIRTAPNDWTGSLAHGDVAGNDPSAGPVFNCLHPEVRRQVKEYFAELADRLSAYPAFEGLSVNLWHATFLWFANLNSGYDDCTVGLFEKETGINLNIDPTDPQRFTKRSEILLEKYREEFIQWRCGKVRDFLCELRDILTARRADLKLGFTVWNETSFFRVYGEKDALSQYGIRKSNYECYREGGFDLALFENEPNIEVSVEENSMRDCDCWDSDGTDTEPEKSHMFSDFAMLDRETQHALYAAKRPVGFHFDCWVEAWRYSGDDPCWFPVNFAITSAFRSEPYFSEWLIHALAAYDARSCTAGGLYLNKSHAAQQWAFAREYRKLADVHFETFAQDPVTVRWAMDGGETCVYLVNCEPYEIGVKLTGSGINLQENLLPFSLTVRFFPGVCRPEKLDISVPEEESGRYEREAAALLTVFERCRREECVPLGMETVERELREALQGKHYARLRHMLSCYSADKARKNLGCGT